MLPNLTLDIIGTALVGLVLGLYVLKNAITSYYEARKTIRGGATDPLITAMGSTWDRNQIERALQAFETMAECLESIAKEQKNETAGDIKKLLSQIDTAELLSQIRRRQEEVEERRQTPPKRR